LHWSVVLEDWLFSEEVGVGLDFGFRGQSGGN
jgi:hypothetical protein